MLVKKEKCIKKSGTKETPGYIPKYIPLKSTLKKYNIKPAYVVIKRLEECGEEICSSKTYKVGSQGFSYRRGRGGPRTLGNTSELKRPSITCSPKASDPLAKAPHHSPSDTSVATIKVFSKPKLHFHLMERYFFKYGVQESKIRNHCISNKISLNDFIRCIHRLLSELENNHWENADDVLHCFYRESEEDITRLVAFLHRVTLMHFQIESQPVVLLKRLQNKSSDKENAKTVSLSTTKDKIIDDLETTENNEEAETPVTKRRKIGDKDVNIGDNATPQNILIGQSFQIKNPPVVLLERLQIKSVNGSTTNKKILSSDKENAKTVSLSTTKDKIIDDLETTQNNKEAKAPVTKRRKTGDSNKDIIIGDNATAENNLESKRKKIKKMDVSTTEDTNTSQSSAISTKNFEAAKIEKTIKAQNPEENTEPDILNFIVHGKSPETISHGKCAEDKNKGDVFVEDIGVESLESGSAESEKINPSEMSSNESQLINNKEVADKNEVSQTSSNEETRVNFTAEEYPENEIVTKTADKVEESLTSNKEERRTDFDAIGCAKTKVVMETKDKNSEESQTSNNDKTRGNLDAKEYAENKVAIETKEKNNEKTHTRSNVEANIRNATEESNETAPLKIEIIENNLSIVKGKKKKSCRGGGEEKSELPESIFDRESETDISDSEAVTTRDCSGTKKMIRLSLEGIPSPDADPYPNQIRSTKKALEGITSSNILFVELTSWISDQYPSVLVESAPDRSHLLLQTMCVSASAV